MAKEEWDFDPAHSSVNFWIRHLKISKVHGRFGQWTGAFEFDEREPASSHIEVQIDAASIDTREAQRDTHLRSADFFDVEMGVDAKKLGKDVAAKAAKVKANAPRTIGSTTLGDGHALTSKEIHASIAPNNGSEVERRLAVRDVARALERPVTAPAKRHTTDLLSLSSDELFATQGPAYPGLRCR